MGHGHSNRFCLFGLRHWRWLKIETSPPTQQKERNGNIKKKRKRENGVTGAKKEQTLLIELYAARLQLQALSERFRSRFCAFGQCFSCQRGVDVRWLKFRRLF